MTGRTRWQLGLGGLIVAFAISLVPILDGTDPAIVATAPDVAADIAQRMWPPDVSGLPALAGPLWDTFAMASLGTLLALSLSVCPSRSWPRAT